MHITSIIMGDGPSASSINKEVTRVASTEQRSLRWRCVDTRAPISSKRSRACVRCLYVCVCELQVGDVRGISPTAEVDPHFSLLLEMTLTFMLAQPSPTTLTENLTSPASSQPTPPRQTHTHSLEVAHPDKATTARLRHRKVRHTQTQIIL